MAILSNFCISPTIIKLILVHLKLNLKITDK